MHPASQLLLAMCLCVFGGCVPRVEGAVVPAGQAPAFTLNDSCGRPVAVDSSRLDGPMVVVFYRGHW